MTEIRQEIAQLREAIAAQAGMLEQIQRTRLDGVEYVPLILRRLTEIERRLDPGNRDMHRPPRISRYRPLGPG